MPTTKKPRRRKVRAGKVLERLDAVDLAGQAGSMRYAGAHTGRYFHDKAMELLAVDAKLAILLHRVRGDLDDERRKPEALDGYALTLCGQAGVLANLATQARWLRRRRERGEKRDPGTAAMAERNLRNSMSHRLGTTLHALMLYAENVGIPLETVAAEMTARLDQYAQRDRLYRKQEVRRG